MPAVEGPGAIVSGRYRLEQLLAVGGMGEVWRATDTRLERAVALKLLRPELAIDKTAIARMTSEARAAAGVRSPQVVGVYDEGLHEASPGVSLPYLVMELADGQPLHEIVSETGPLPPERVAVIVQQVAAGLAAAHEGGLVHRDIKPSNIMVTEQDTVKITDFGIARRHTGEDLTTTGTIVGTARYLAPEQVQGRLATASSDMYALGLVAYECLTARPAFEGETDTTMALARLHSAPPPLPQSVPEPLRSVVGALLIPEPEGRPTAAAVSARLEGRATAAEVAATTVLAAPATTRVLDRPVAAAAPEPTRVSGWAVAAGLLVLAAIAAVVVVLLLLRHGGGTSPITTPPSKKPVTRATSPTTGGSRTPQSSASQPASSERSTSQSFTSAPPTPSATPTLSSTTPSATVPSASSTPPQRSTSASATGSTTTSSKGPGKGHGPSKSKKH